MRCQSPMATGRDGKLLLPCEAQERVIDRLRAENAALRRRCAVLQRIVDAARRPGPERGKTRAERARERAARLFGTGG